ncbi:hypothetical protein H6G89_17355 [Oscillatoria sp. FACHB-1407]|uniref:hypothetical protein n=1 Tax=Oscillatoria sp. FACHB-1407 TaxID=2692847 RepID=UPI001682356F|nr:hypothetical protein [Oscillatoria sp. FACHB-1407]MBD2462809.1 hypothetical protein [Oscillatoria sp. FACHB-1407]
MTKSIFQQSDRPSKPGMKTWLSWALLAGGLSLVPSQVVASPLLQGDMTAAQTTAERVSPHLKQTQPDVLPIPLAIVQPNGNAITIQVINATGAELSYQVIGDTQFRALGAQSQATLQDLGIPTTLTFRRNDGGLISPTIEANNSTSTLTLILQATEDFTVDRTALRIEPTGAVYLN